MNMKPKSGNSNYTAVYNEQPTLKKKLSYKEKKEFEQLEKEIADLESKKRKVTEELTNGSLPYEEVQKLSKEIGNITAQLEEKEMKWLQYSEFES